MESTNRAYPGSISGSSISSNSIKEEFVDLLQQPYELRHGRRFLRELPYPLPVDLQEIQRQNVRTMMGCEIFGSPVAAPTITKSSVPKRVLELGCGSGYWSAICHEYFTSLGHPNVEFVGLDVAPLAPDLKKQGLNWTFVQHDMRRTPFPFEDGHFDYIMLKDMGLAVPLGPPSQQLTDECIRICREEGTVEIWESDHCMRCLLPHPSAASAKDRHAEDLAIATGTFLFSPGTPFAPAQNKYIVDSNSWIQEAFDRRKLPPFPCARVAQILFQEPEHLADVGSRRIAIPLGELHWEKERLSNGKRSKSSSNLAASAKGKGKVGEASLTPDQAALRMTALWAVLGKIESLEPLLKEVSGKNSEEWAHWWASMMTNLLEQKGASSGECLEFGAWWATKRTTL
ncbi:hypothetical protein M8818_000037 [Zalaria obscura]|uniref:Uncharacterized protein n=1 Tax=Zalaria obscura TaxID=2024903 RepID=A0ACC3SQU9_9PEZI